MTTNSTTLPRHPSRTTLALQRKLIRRWLGEHVPVFVAAEALGVRQQRLERWLRQPRFQHEAFTFLASLEALGALQRASDNALPTTTATTATTAPETTPGRRAKKTDPQPPPAPTVPDDRLAELLSRLRPSGVTQRSQREGDRGEGVMSKN